MTSNHESPYVGFINDNMNRCSGLLPAWFIPRMMEDSWYLGLLLVSGDVLAISSITNVSVDANNNLWIDALMCEQGINIDCDWYRVLKSPNSRLAISVNASHIIAAFELADT